MTVLLIQLDGSLPNVALMRLAAHHRGRGEVVELRYAPTVASVAPGLFSGYAGYSRVYASLIFERTRPVAERLLTRCPAAIVGGTGWDLSTRLEDLGVGVEQDYSIYPDYPRSIGFTQRGCRLKCSFCVVPRKEGAVKESATIAEVWRGEPWPRHLVLLDNDFFGQPNWRDRVAEVREGGFRVNFNQGINCRMIDEEAAEAIASVDYRDEGMTRKRVYTAWDSLKDEDRLFRGLRLLAAAGVKPAHIMVYILIGYWPGETEADWLHRAARLREFGADPYPMPYVRNRLTVGFQRWVVPGYDKRVGWDDWKAAGCEPRNLGGRRVELPLFREEA